MASMTTCKTCKGKGKVPMKTNGDNAPGKLPRSKGRSEGGGDSYARKKRPINLGNSR